MMGKNTNQGITLIELVIVVAILSILTAVAYPLYTAQVQKGRRAEARSMAMKLAFAEEQYRSLRGSYLDVDSLADITSLGLDATDWNTASGTGLFKYYDYDINVPSSNPNQFLITITPRGSQAADSSKCATFTMDQLLKKGATGSTASSCW